MQHSSCSRDFSTLGQHHSRMTPVEQRGLPVLSHPSMKKKSLSKLVLAETLAWKMWFVCAIGCVAGCLKGTHFAGGQQELLYQTSPGNTVSW